MKLITTGLCLALGAVGLAHAEPEAAPQTGAPREALLWRVSDGENALLLLGSIHVLRDQDLPLPTPVLEAYAQTEVLVMELDLTADPAGELQRKYQDFGAAAPLRPLDVAL
ncbi:MAG: TraB/GumN family protein, partial [Pseudomonadota bacterium]